MSHTATRAETDAPILDVLAERWSTRVYDESATIDDQALASALEAARWAPSAFNGQPWRLVVARRGSETFTKITETLIGFNQGWAPHASAFVVFLAENPTDGSPLTWRLYDVGQAAAYFTVQAHSDGLFTHQMSGFDGDALVSTLGLEGLTALTVMTVGALGDITDTSIDPELAKRELAPRERRALEDTILIND